MIANPPPIAIAVNGRSVGAIGVRWRGKNPGEMCQRCGRVWLYKPGICSHCAAREKKQNPKRRASTYSVPEQHQRKIAAQTLRMSDVFARIMGGMTKEEARRILRRNPSAAAMSQVLGRYGLQAVRHKGEARQLYRQLGLLARARGVPRRTFRRSNPANRPSEVEIYADIERIYATKGRRSAAPGEPFVHNFRHAAAFGRPDGTVVLRGRGGRRLWDHFRA